MKKVTLLAPGTVHQVNPIGSEFVPTRRIANVFREENRYRLSDFRIFSKGSREKTRARRVQNMKIGAKNPGNTRHHWSDPRGVCLGFHAVFDNCLKKRISLSRTEGVVSDLPIHAVLVTQETIQR
jgi:hypothetical protein